MKAKLVGVQGIHFTNNSGEEVNGTKIYCAFQDKNVEGLCTADFFLKDGITLPKDTKLKGDKEAWERFRPLMRNPVIKVFDLKEDVKLPVKAGITALSEYSMLADNNYPTYAIDKKGIASSGIRDMKQVGRGEDIGCRVLELGYIIDGIKKDVQDPLSVMLSISDEMDDERVEASVNEMLKEYVW